MTGASQFTSRRYGDELHTLGVRSRPTMIGSPEQNGIIERFFGSLKDEEVWTTEYDTRAEAIEAINEPDRDVPIDVKGMGRGI